MDLVFDYPSWFLLLCLLAGAIYAAALYTRDRLNRHFRRLLIYLLAFMRFVVVSVLAFFLMKPLIKTVDRSVEKPIVVIAQDNSESLLVGQDSVYMQNTYLNNLNLLRDALSQEYDVRSFSFGQEVKEGIDGVDFTEKITDYSQLMDELDSRFSNRNLGAFIIASDGLYNQGMNPLYAYGNAGAPVFAVALGDTTDQKDILIKEALHNRLSYLGNRFPLEIMVEGSFVDGETKNLTVSRSGNVLHSESITFDGDHSTHVSKVLLDANKTGIQRYDIRIGSVSDEITTVNNSKSIFIDVLDSRQKVLVLGNSAHPDIGCLTNAINSNDNYEATNALVDDFDGNIPDYSLIIFHQLPGRTTQERAYVQQAMEADIPALFVLGSATDFSAFNDLQVGYQLKGYNGTLSEVNASLSEVFSLFSTNDDESALVRKFPPLHQPFGNLEFSPGVSNLIDQRLGLIETDSPLLSFNKKGDGRIGVIVGEGIWRWRLFSYLEKGSHELFDGLISKTVQLLASKEDKSRFRVSGKNNWLENEAIVFKAELYNAAYELVNEEDISMRITDEDGNDYTFTFGRSGSSYRLDAGSLPVGNYTYEGRSSQEGEMLTERGEFSVSPVQLELTNTKADLQLLYNWASNTGGDMVERDELEKIPELIKAANTAVPVSHETKLLSDLINTRWILGLILLLLSLEWLLRKRNGTY